MCWDGFGLGLVKIQFKINSVLILKDGIGWARGRHSLRQARYKKPAPYKIAGFFHAGLI